MDANAWCLQSRRLTRTTGTPAEPVSSMLHEEAWFSYLRIYSVSRVVGKRKTSGLTCPFSG